MVQFTESFHWLCHHEIGAFIQCPTNMEGIRPIVLGVVIFYFIPVFYSLGDFLKKQLFGYYSQLGATSLIGYLSSKIKRARVK